MSPHFTDVADGAPSLAAAEPESSRLRKSFDDAMDPLAVVAAAAAGTALVPPLLLVTLLATVFAGPFVAAIALARAVRRR